MARSIIIVLYVSVGILAAAGSIFISQKIFSAKAEQIFFAVFLITIAAFYLPFTAYFGDQRAWRLRSDVLLVEKSEAASALIYWNGKRYVWSQQGD